MLHTKDKKTVILRRMIFLIIGAALVSIGLEMFLVPNKIIDGGVVGLSIILSHLTGFNYGLLIFLLNIPFLMWGYKQIGKTFALSTIFAAGVLAIGTSLLHSIRPLTEEPLLAAVFGGILIGIGVGITLRYGGGSFDGTEIVALVFSKKSPFSVGEIVMFINIFILSSAGFVFTWDSAMYSLLAYFIIFKTIDITIEGLDESKSVWIISDNHQEIGEAILARLGRGVTYLAGEGGYSGEAKKVIFAIITRLEEAKLKSIVEEKDPAAFLAIGNIHDIKGGRFKKKDIH